VLSGEDEPPAWELPALEVHESDPTPYVRDRYAEARDLTLSQVR
jgi:xylulokinase